MHDRFAGALEGLILAGVMAAVFFLVALVVRVTAKKQIGSARYYGVAIIGGFLLHPVLNTVLAPIPPDNSGASSSEFAPSEATGLDALFLPPDEGNLERFPTQLQTSMEQLSKREHDELSTAISFLSFAVAANLAEEDPTKFDGADDNDLATKSLLRLYRYAQNQGRSMTLRKYIELSEELKRQKPEWWAQFAEVPVRVEP